MRRRRRKKGRNRKKRLKRRRNGRGMVYSFEYLGERTMVKNSKKHRKNSHLITHFFTSEGVSKVSERENE